MNTRRAWYWAAFLGVAGLVAVIPEYFFANDAELVVQPSERATKPALKRPLVDLDVGAVVASTEAAQQVPQDDLFAVRSWRVAPPYRPVVAAPVVPTVYRPSAPPLPFQFIGKLDDHAHLRVFLQEGEQVHVVQVGDVIGGTYKVQKITANQMTLLYLPLKISQSMAVGSTL